jgi:integrase
MPLSIFKRGDVYHYRGTVAGRRLRGSTSTSDKVTAQRIAAEREAREWKGHLDGPEAILTFAQAAILYRSAHKPVRFLQQIEDYWKNTPVKSINSGAVRKAALAIKPTGTGATRNRQVIIPTQAIINHAAKLDLCRTLKVERFPVSFKSKEPATWEWVQAFMAHASPHLGALACFMFMTGARITEALNVRWRDVDLQGRKALIRQTKIGAERRAHLPPALLVAIANIPSDRDPGEKVFRYSRRDTATPVWKAAIKRAKVKPLTFHSCRHGFATAMMHQGIDPITVAKLGGWKSPEHVFKTYGHAMSDETITDRIIGTPQTQGGKPASKDVA